jgi:hypothetical protein
MATATLTFDLNEPDDVQAHLRCVKSTDMAIALWDIVYEVKKGTERQLEAKETSTDAEFKLHEKIFEQIFEVLEERGIKIDDLIS